MWGRLLIFSGGVAGGILGKTLYDRHKASCSKDSTEPEPRTEPKAEADSMLVIRECQAEIERLAVELEAVKNSVDYIDYLFMDEEAMSAIDDKEAELEAAQKRLVELTRANQATEQAKMEASEDDCSFLHPAIRRALRNVKDHLSIHPEIARFSKKVASL